MLPLIVSLKDLATHCAARNISPNDPRLAPGKYPGGHHTVLTPENKLRDLSSNFTIAYHPKDNHDIETISKPFYYELKEGNDISFMFQYIHYLSDFVAEGMMISII